MVRRPLSDRAGWISDMRPNREQLSRAASTVHPDGCEPFAIASRELRTGVAWPILESMSRVVRRSAGDLRAWRLSPGRRPNVNVATLYQLSYNRCNCRRCVPVVSSWHWRYTVQVGQLCGPLCSVLAHVRFISCSNWRRIGTRTTGSWPSACPLWSARRRTKPDVQTMWPAFERYRLNATEPNT